MPTICSRVCEQQRRARIPLAKVLPSWPSMDPKPPAEDSASLHHAFYHDYRVFWLALKIMGIFPYHISKTGDLKFNYLSKEMLYALVVYGLCSVPVFLVLCIRFTQRMAYAGSFDAEICLYMLSFMLVPHLVVPVSHWLHMNRTVATFQKWRNFECSYEAVMKEKLYLHCCWSSHLYLLPGVLFICSAVLLEYIINAADYVWEIVAHVYVLFFLCLHLIILLGITYRLVQIARLIRFKLKEAIHLEDIVLVSELCSLWAKFGETCHLLGCLFHPMYGYLLVMIFSTSTITWYSILKAFTSNDFHMGLLYQISCLINNALWLHFLCEGGERITAESGKKFIRLIATSKPFVKNAAMKNELDGFLSTISSLPVALSINGYVSINRRLLVSIKSTMVTYLIVVLQFSQDFSSASSTNSSQPIGNDSLVFFDAPSSRKCLFSP